MFLLPGSVSGTLGVVVVVVVFTPVGVENWSQSSVTLILVVILHSGKTFLLHLTWSPMGGSVRKAN